jgi:hypothetical protein
MKMEMKNKTKNSNTDFNWQNVTDDMRQELINHVGASCFHSVTGNPESLADYYVDTINADDPAMDCFTKLSDNFYVHKPTLSLWCHPLIHPDDTQNLGFRDPSVSRARNRHIIKPVFEEDVIEKSYLKEDTKNAKRTHTHGKRFKNRADDIG